MVRGKASGYSLDQSDIPVLLGMLVRGDRDHDVAAWFGVNQGRIADAKDGKWGTPPGAPANSLPPSGPPGIKGRRLRAAVDKAIFALGKGDLAEAAKLLAEAAKLYDRSEA